MAYIYAYAPEETDCATIGLVGALLDEDARFELKAGALGTLTFSHPIDPYGKWRALVNGAILKTMVPMRLCPGVKEDGGYVGTVDVYSVAATATKNQRYIYSKRRGGKRKKLLPAGQSVTVTGVADAADPGSRLAVRVGRVSGWMERAGLSLERQAVPVEADGGGLEAVEPSYAVRQQLFRVCRVEPRSGRDDPGSLTVFARRIAYDLLGNLTTYRTDGMVGCGDACRGILENALMPHDFSVYTDIADARAGFDAADKSPVAALLDPEGGAAARWGAEVVADDFDIYLLRRAGLDRGVRIESDRNLIGVDVRIDASNAVGALRPRGEARSGAALYLDGHVIDGRHGYNYDAGRRTCADWLPEGYRFYTDPDGAVEGTVVVRAEAGGVAPKLMALDVRDAKVEKGSAGVTAAVARRMLAQAAVGRFGDGCDRPEVSMRVDFVLLGDAEAYAQYRHLEPLFVYDTVHIRDRRTGVEADARLTSMRWLVRQERVAEADFGALTGVAAPVAAWQITGSISGERLAAGTLGAGQLADDCVSARHVQADSINAEAIQAESITADHLAAHAVDAQSLTAVEAEIRNISATNIHTNTLAAAFASLFSVVAGKISAREIEADKLDAIVENVVTLTAGSADFDVETVRHLVSSVLSVTRLIGGMARIDNLYVTNANLVNATLDALTVKGSDDNYYDIAVGSDGVLSATLREVTQAEIDAGETADGRGIVGDVDLDVVGADGIDGKYIEDAETGLMTLYVSALSAGHITATTAFIGSGQIPSLETTSVKALGKSIDISANETILMQTGDDTKGLRRVLRLDLDGLHVGDHQASGEVLIDSESVNVVMYGNRYSRFAANYAQFGNYQLRRTSDGGLVFKMAL